MSDTPTEAATETVEQIQFKIKEAAHLLRQRFEQIETIGYAEIMYRVEEIETLAGKLPDAPAAGEGADAKAAAPMTLAQHIENLEHLARDDLWNLVRHVSSAARAATR